jgi:putative mRNA 3-end processing factor
MSLTRPIRPEALLAPRSSGLYCAPGDFYIDPVRPVDRAVITHGHADHARAGHGSVLATPETLAIMAVRYGEGFCSQRQAAAYGQTVSINGVEVRFAPAGHVLGSAQAVITFQGCRIVVTGDYKRAPDPTCAQFEPVACDVLVSEATFGLPVFRHSDGAAEVRRLMTSVARQPDRTHLVGAYALGKAQRLIALLRQEGWDRPIYVHGAMEKLCALYEDHGVTLGPLLPATIATGGKASFAGEIVIAPPSAMAEKWSRRFADPVDCFASGWMRVRQRAKARGVELPLVISDHADWDELTATITEVAPGEVWITHGREDALLRWCALNGQAARALALVGYDEEGE